MHIPFSTSDAAERMLMNSTSPRVTTRPGSALAQTLELPICCNPPKSKQMNVPFFIVPKFSICSGHILSSSSPGPSGSDKRDTKRKKTGSAKKDGNCEATSPKMAHLKEMALQSNSLISHDAKQSSNAVALDQGVCHRQNSISVFTTCMHVTHHTCHQSLKMQDTSCHELALSNGDSCFFANWLESLMLTLLHQNLLTQCFCAISHAMTCFKIVANNWIPLENIMHSLTGFFPLSMTGMLIVSMMPLHMVVFAKKLFLCGVVLTTMHSNDCFILVSVVSKHF